jgi:hypothetical protein
VWRIEHVDGKGPYSYPDITPKCPCDGEERWTCEHEREMTQQEQDRDQLRYDMGYAHTDSAHPGPYNRTHERQLCDVWTMQFSCCFTDADQMSAWFDGWWERLADCGYLLTEWEVDEGDVLVGTRQSGFRRDLATLVSSRPAGL